MVDGRLNDISLILAKAKRAGFFEDVNPNEVDFLQQEAKSLFGNDTTLNSTYGRGYSSKTMLSPVVFAGDSITTNAGAAFALAGALGAYPSSSSLDAGVAGNTSTQLLARFDTDVIAKNPRIVHILVGTNDATTPVTVSAYAANIKAMVAKCQAIGARIIIGLLPPGGSGTPATRPYTTISYNQWLARYALINGFQIADYYKALVDPATGNYLAAYDSGDHIHPSAAGISAMADELKASVSRDPSASVLLTKDTFDPCNFVRSALFLSGFSGWSVVGAPTGVTVSGVADSAIQGQWGKISAVASSGTAEYFQRQSTTQGGQAYVPGNWQFLGARIASTALSSNQYHLWRALWYSGFGQMIVGTGQNKWCNTSAVLCNEAASVVGSTSIQPDIQLTAGTGDVSIAQATMYDLTAMGVTDINGNLV